jgi:hypothetical protein
MPTRKYALTKGGPLRLEILTKGTWKDSWKDVSVRLDGNEIGTIATKKLLKEGREFYLEDGSILKLRLVTRLFHLYDASEIQVTLNGEPLPEANLNSLIFAYGVIFFIGGGQLIIGSLGFIMLLSGVKMAVPSPMIGMIFLLISGVIFLWLGSLVKRKSMIALITAVILYELGDNFSSFFEILQQGNSLSFGKIFGEIFGIFIEAFILVLMLQGFKAIRTSQ